MSRKPAATRGGRKTIKQTHPLEKSVFNIVVAHDANKLEAEYVVFSGSHIFVDDEILEKIRAGLGEESDQVPGELVFYYDGTENLELITVPGEEKVARIYSLAAEEQSKGEYKFSGAAIGFKSGFPYWLHKLLEDILPIGGLSDPISSGIIKGDDTIIQFYHYDTYM